LIVSKEKLSFYGEQKRLAKVFQKFIFK